MKALMRVIAILAVSIVGVSENAKAVESDCARCECHTTGNSADKAALLYCCSVCGW